jgi:hypothetical protein
MDFKITNKQKMDSKKNYMKNYIFTLMALFSCTITVLGQNSSSLLIDNVSTVFSNVSLPYWLKSGQTLALGTNSKSVSILEFTVNGTALEFSQVISLTSVQTVPQNKVWKIEAIGQNTVTNSTSILNSNFPPGSVLPTILQSPRKFEVQGTFDWTVPSGITSICVEVWGGGGGSAYGYGLDNGFGGGGGGYGYQCFSVIPGTTYQVIVGGNSSVGTLISATAGGGGASGGIGGTSSATFSINGGNGGTFGGGNGGNGSAGGSGSGSNGGIPGGGAGAGCGNCGTVGGRGQVYIYW